MAAPTAERLRRLKAALAGPVKFLEAESNWASGHDAGVYLDYVDQAVTALTDLLEGYNRDDDKDEE